MTAQTEIELPSGTPYTEQEALEEILAALNNAYVGVLFMTDEEINNAQKYEHGVCHGRFKVTISVKEIKPFE